MAAAVTGDCSDPLGDLFLPSLFRYIKKACSDRCVDVSRGASRRRLQCVVHNTLSLALHFSRVLSRARRAAILSARAKIIARARAVLCAPAPIELRSDSARGSIGIQWTVRGFFDDWVGGVDSFGGVGRGFEGCLQVFRECGEKWTLDSGNCLIRFYWEGLLVGTECLVVMIQFNV